MVNLTDKEQLVRLQRRIAFTEAGYNVDDIEQAHITYTEAVHDLEVAQSIVFAYELSNKAKWLDEIIEPLNCKLSFMYASRGSDYLRCETCGLEIEQYRGRPGITNYKPPGCKNAE
jgi:2',3'-cyclic-nucleotide 2'-phosphodiesterase (5'-nucleotidase family)